MLQNSELVTKEERSFDDGGSIDAFTIRMVRGTSGKPTEVISDPREVKFATGGGVEFVPVSQKISKKEKDEFLEYIDGFYGKKGIYADDLKGGFSKVELRKAMNTYLKELGSAPTWGYGDSVDRERVRQILQPSYKMFNEGGFMSRLLTRKKDQPKVETINDDIDLKEDSRIRVKPTSFVSKDKEADWMMKKNSSKEARAYAGGGKISIRDIDWSNDDNKKLGVWLLTSVDGNKILQNSKNAKELEKNVMDYYKKRGSVARMKWDEDEDEGLSWVTFGDLFLEVKSLGSDKKMATGGKTETTSKKGKGNHKMKATTDLARKIRKDGEKWTDAIKRASQQLK
jgi:hypothetical protein